MLGADIAYAAHMRIARMAPYSSCGSQGCGLGRGKATPPTDRSSKVSQSIPLFGRQGLDLIYSPSVSNDN